MFTACSSPASKNKSAEDKQVTIEFSGSVDGVIKNPGFTLTLYGRDSRMADVAATRLWEKKYNKSELPFTITLDIPADAADRITPAVSAKENIAYYVALSWDSNGDGQAGNAGDIVIDFDKKFPEIKTDGSVQQVFIKWRIL